MGLLNAAEHLFRTDGIAGSLGGGTDEFWATFCVMCGFLVLKIILNRFLLLFIENARVKLATQHSMETEPFFMILAFCWGRFSTPPTFAVGILKIYTLCRCVSWIFSVFLGSSFAAPVKIFNSCVGESMLLFVALQVSLFSCVCVCVCVSLPLLLLSF